MGMKITLTVNGAVRQKGNLSELIWNVAETIEQLRRVPSAAGATS